MSHSAQKSAEKSNLGREDWLKATLALLAETGGPEGIRIDALCRRLGVTKGSFYWHFKSRSDLIDSLIDYWSGQFHHDVQAELGTVPSDQPLAFLQALTDFWRSGSFASTDAAMRRWAATDPRVAQAIACADHIIMDRMVEMFQGLGKSAAEARDLAFVLIAIGVATPQLAHLRDTSTPLAEEQEAQNVLRLILGNSENR